MEGLFRNKARGIDTQMEKFIQIYKLYTNSKVQQQCGHSSEAQDSETHITCLTRQGQDH